MANNADRHATVQWISANCAYERLDELIVVLASLRETLRKRRQKIPSGGIDDILDNQILSFLDESAKVLELSKTMPIEKKELAELHILTANVVEDARRIGRKILTCYPQYSDAFF